MPSPAPPSTPTDLIGGWLTVGLAKDPDALALASATKNLSWRELQQQSSRLASGYLSLGLSPGDRVASLMPNHPELIVHYLACLKAGLVATPLNYRYTAAEIDHALAVSGAAMLLHHAEREPDIAATQQSGRLRCGLVRCGAPDARGPQLEELLDRPADQRDLSPPPPDSPAFIYFTSGSTGKPKGVTHTQQTFAWMTLLTIRGLELTADDAFLSAASLSHIGGSLFGLATLARGARLVIARRGEGPEVLPLLRNHRPTVLWMLPAALIALVRDHDAGRADFSSVRCCFSGGDKVSAELEREFTSLAGFPVDESYGMTECGLTTINPPAGENRIGSVGQPISGYEVSLRDDSGGEVPTDEPGRLWLRSAANTPGYWDNPRATREAIVDGWLDTGDVMRADPEGYLWFCGRKKQIIIHDGSNICPQEVEEAVAGHAAIASAGVIGVHDAVHGENVRAYVTLREGAPRPTTAEVIAFARQQVGYKAPDEVVVLDRMPLNATGKVDRVALKQMAMERLATG
ncbi:Long-chain-fatty-acid--CoA ligase [Posidoniimonas corsicana]|uniref:Long-chain-fatty-acid--CoA ligase n=1 Tax=Posidoniimonas corsicana TaxID=1938618 RepID=A0A5C5VCH2_9BACT|nr:class I adenylate-forming enzyme family protein [Posidoniimonas corsicana]TWT36278.1 Long-chain-fatty-acid--CoA ligase [Posidoniimonas corsicana]